MVLVIMLLVCVLNLGIKHDGDLNDDGIKIINEIDDIIGLQIQMVIFCMMEYGYLN
jgi:hypothetical protein